MKRICSAVLLLALMLYGAKTTLAQSFNAGLIAGATFSQVDGDSYYGFHKVGFTAGTYVSLPVANHFALQMELKYTQMGAHSSAKEIIEYNYPAYNLRLHYAEIPLMLRYDFGHFTVYGKSLDNLALELGLSLDFLLKYRGEIEAATQTWKLHQACGHRRTDDVFHHADANQSQPAKALRPFLQQGHPNHDDLQFLFSPAIKSMFLFRPSYPARCTAERLKSSSKSVGLRFFQSSSRMAKSRSEGSNSGSLWGSAKRL